MYGVARVCEGLLRLPEEDLTRWDRMFLEAYCVDVWPGRGVGGS